jgi:AraC-like DNA-binding protein
MSNAIHREITPLREGDSLLVFDRKKVKFDFPIHFHPEYELNFIFNGTGAKRSVGDHFDNIYKLELVLIAPNLPHGWEQGDCISQSIHEITIQFPKDLFPQKLLDRNMMKPVRDLLNMSSRGVLFSEETIIRTTSKINSISEKRGLDSFLEFSSLLYYLALSPNKVLLSDITDLKEEFYNSEKLRKLHEFIQKNYTQKISIKQAAEFLSMSEVTFSRLVKNHTNYTFVEFLNDYRIGYSTRLLLESDLSIAEIAYQCGFNNISNYNRRFKKRKNCTPREYRNNFVGIKAIK